ncbi:hypothetical protein Tco_0506485 [Tanacetum coccineum]
MGLHLILHHQQVPLELQEPLAFLGRLIPQPPHPPHSNILVWLVTKHAAPQLIKTAASAEYTAWKTTDTKIKPSVSPIPEELHMDDDTTTDEQAYSSSGEDIGHDHIPTRTHYLLIGDMENSWTGTAKARNSELTQKRPGWPAYECQRYNVSKPLPLGGDPGYVTIQPDFFFNKDLEYLWYGRKMGRPAFHLEDEGLPITPDVGLEQMVPDQMWIEEECKYDVAVMYGISHWWFQRQRFYIDRHTSEGDRRAVRTHMHILSVVRIEVFSMCGYNYMKKIILRRADLKEYVIQEDFKSLYPRDFKDLYSLNHSVIDSPRAVTFRDKYGVQMIMRFNEIHKFSDGTLQQIDEALDYRVKEFRVNRMNPGLDIRFWMKKDVDRSKEFIYIGNPVKEFRLKMNLPDHRSVLTDPKVQVKMEMEIPYSNGVNSLPHAYT